MLKRKYFNYLRHWRRVVDLGLLYASKSGGVVVGVFVLPWYQGLLGPDAFGVVAMIISLQAFLLMLDLGTSTLVARDVAVSKYARGHLVTWRAAEMLLHLVYAGLLIFALFLNFILDKPLLTLQVFLCIVLFWALTVQNVGQSALLAKRKYTTAGGIQVVGVLSRAGITLTALTYIRPELEVFLLAQTLTAVISLMVTSWFCRRVLNFEDLSISSSALRSRITDLAQQGKPLVLYGLSGAAVMQLDKVIVPLFSSHANLTPYFLASSLCLTPISVLAGPVNQYFFPKIVESINNKDAIQITTQLKKLIFSIFFVVTIPSLILWHWRETIINIWLHQQPIATEVVHCLEILLPGIALGSMGYVPYNILVANEDYRMHSILSTGLTILTLLATALAAAFSSILAVCWVYAIYHSFSAIVAWWRAIYLVSPPEMNYAKNSAYFTLVLLVVFSTITTVVSLLLFWLSK